MIAQNEDNASSGTRITSLQFDMSSSILISGDQSGTVSYSMTIRRFLVYVFHALAVKFFSFSPGPYHHIQKRLKRQYIILFTRY
jgi:hypothetical protein